MISFLHFYFQEFKRRLILDYDTKISLHISGLVDIDLLAAIRGVDQAKKAPWSWNVSK